VATDLPSPPDLVPGLEAVVEAEVGADMLASSVGSGEVEVLATPALLALVEKAACKALREALPSGMTSVGVTAALTHSAPTPPGATVKAWALLESVSGGRLTFSFRVEDGVGEVAAGSHVRAMVDRAAFEAATRARQG
jgi:fluoroacetyl-CoA thioesterase